MVACKGGPETRHLVSAAVIDALGPEGTLINVARGTVVEERALIDALAKSVSAMPRSTCSRASPNLARLLACRMSSCSRTTAAPRSRPAPPSAQLMIDNLSAHFAGRPLLTPVW